jgi:hypothetical protein
VLAAGGAVLGALLAANGLAFIRGADAPWLLGAVILADILVAPLGFGPARLAVPGRAAPRVDSFT